MRRALRKRLPALTRFTYGAIHPLNIDELAFAEVTVYLRALARHEAEVARQRQIQLRSRPGR